MGKKQVNVTLTYDEGETVETVAKKGGGLKRRYLFPRCTVEVDPDPVVLTNNNKAIKWKGKDSNNDKLKFKDFKFAHPAHFNNQAVAGPADEPYTVDCVDADLTVKVPYKYGFTVVSINGQDWVLDPEYERDDDE
jgi:hypothetical protein